MSGFRLRPSGARVDFIVNPVKAVKAASKHELNSNVKRYIIMNGQIKSRQRVSNFGEVYTAHRQVSDMLDLIPDDAAGISATYLEPACGNGNFIVEILKRKFGMITTRNPWLYSVQQLRCVSSVYGVDIQKDNTVETVERIVRVYVKVYSDVFHCLPDRHILEAVRNIASRNIVCGDTLTATMKDGRPLIFHEWDIREDGRIFSAEYAFAEMLQNGGVGTTPVRRHRFRWLYNVASETA